MPLELGENHDADIEIEGQYLDQAETRGDMLLTNIFTDTAEELLSDWERVLDITPAGGATIAARQIACTAKLNEIGCLSRPAFITLAAALGYTIEIVEPWPFYPGINAPGDPIYISDITLCWRVDVQYIDPDAVTQAEFEAAFERLKPAHTYVYFTYP